jgi:hypothetical protein
VFLQAYNEEDMDEERFSNVTVMSHSSAVNTFKVDYAELYSGPLVGGVYLLLYLKNPVFQLHDPL